MNCEKAAEFVSALFDGERIPREAAEHIGGCTSCGDRMQEYAVMGAELRRSAIMNQAPARPALPERGGFFSILWQKSTARVRIPRFAFVMMLLLLVTLSASLAITRANNSERWFQYKLSGRDGKSIVTATVPSNPNGNPYYDVDAGMSYPEGTVWFYLRVLGRAGNQERILAKTFWVAKGSQFAPEGIQGAPSREFLAASGRDLKIPVDGYGSLNLNGRFEAVLPENVRNGLYPEDDKVRIYPPVALIRGNTMVSKGDSGGGQFSTTDSYFAFGSDEQGWYFFAPKPIEGWTQGTISVNQIEFNMDGERHFLLAGMPITFGSVPVWVKRYASIRGADPSSHWDSAGAKPGVAYLVFGKLENLRDQK